MMERRAEAIAKSAKGIVDAQPGVDQRLREAAVAQLQREHDRLVREIESLTRTKAGLADEISATRAAANLEAAETKGHANEYFLKRKAEGDHYAAEYKQLLDQQKDVNNIAIRTAIAALRKPMRQAHTDAMNECKRIVDHFFDAYDGGEK
jgi:hypothetical protein